MRLRRMDTYLAAHHDDTPKSRVGEAHEMAACLIAAEELHKLTGALLALLQEEEGEET